MSSVAVFSPAVLPAFPDEALPETLEAKRARAVGAMSSSIRPASALEVRPAPEMMPFGIAALDELTGGVPRGSLTEMVGPPSSGRTSLMMSVMASVTRRQEVCALIDVTDSFDPESAQAAGVDLKRLLWVRCGKTVSSSFEFPVSKTPQRNAERRPASLNTVAPPAKNISWSIHENYDARLRHAILGGCHEAVPRKEVSTFEVKDSSSKKVWGRAPSPVQAERTSAVRPQSSKWTRLDQALKATDLLLQGGGFGLIVIDLGDISIEQARRIPLTSWFRFRRVVENTATILLVVARDSCAKTCASLVLQLEGQAVKSGEQVPSCKFPVSSSEIRETTSTRNPKLETRNFLSHINLLDGLDVRVELIRTRLERKPVRSVGVQVETQTSWRKGR
jgi:recombination protein RecA